MTDDMSHLDDLVAEREASAPSRPRRDVGPSAPVVEATAPEWAHLLISRLDRIGERVERVEASMGRIIGRVAQLDGMENRLLDGLQPFLMRRQDDVVLLKERLTAVADDVRELRARLEPLLGQLATDDAATASELRRLPDRSA